MPSISEQELATAAELLVQEGADRPARLLRLVGYADANRGASGWRVLLHVAPAHMPLFAAADLSRIEAAVNRLARFDGAKVEASVTPLVVSGAAGAGRDRLGLDQLIVAIAEALAEAVKSYDLPAVCVRYGLADGDEDEAFRSKRVYVKKRLAGWGREQLILLADRVLNDYDDPQLWALLESAAAPGGVAGHAKNLIFAADGPKPKIILRDAVSNTVEIVENGQYCLIYDRPVPDRGLSWANLVEWWSETGDAPAGASEKDAANTLHARLGRSLDRGIEPTSEAKPETQVFRAYTRLLKEHGFDLPALLPQVYLHYDPYVRNPHRPGPLVRQRMDFLLLLPRRVRVVIEVDGQQHYADKGKSSPRRYAQMMAEDRRLRLAGYEVYRFGAYDLLDADAAQPLLADFFGQLLARYGILGSPEAPPT